MEILPHFPFRGMSGPRSGTWLSPPPALFPEPFSGSFSLGILLVVIAYFALPLGAQERPEAERGDGPGVFQGVLLDMESGTPIEGAQVYLPEQNIGFLTRADGGFRIPDIPSGSHEVEIQRIGYTQARFWVDFHDPFPPLQLQLLPDPVILEGFEVVADRFERRRRSAATSIRVFGEAQLLTSAAHDVVDLVTRHMGMTISRCPGHIREPWCVHSRGRPFPPSVYIDEAPVIGGIDQLMTYPPHEFHMVEVYGGGRHIRAYTHRFMEWAARIRLAPIPFF